MLQQFIMLTVNALLAILDARRIRGFIDAGLVEITRRVKTTTTTTDDKLVLPAVNLLRAAIELPGSNGEVDIDAELRKLFKALGESSYQFIDAGLDWVEDEVSKTSSTIDDIVVLPVCRLIREVLNIEDNDSIEDNEEVPV